MKVTVQSKEERGGEARRGREGAEEIKDERGRQGGREVVLRRESSFSCAN